MTRKALLILAVILAGLFSFAIFTQGQGQEAATKGSDKIITYGDLQTQKETIEGLRKNYEKIQADYNAECKEKTYKTMNEYPKEECDKKFSQLTKSYNDLKKEVEAYNKDVAQFQAGSVQKATNRGGSSVKGN
jgi:archaellum component FlaC